MPSPPAFAITEWVAVLDTAEELGDLDEEIEALLGLARTRSWSAGWTVTGDWPRGSGWRPGPGAAASSPRPARTSTGLWTESGTPPCSADVRS